MSSLLSGSLSPTPAHPLASLFCVTRCHIATRSLRGEAVQTLFLPPLPRGMLGTVVWGLLVPFFSDFADQRLQTDQWPNAFLHFNWN